MQLEETNPNETISKYLVEDTKGNLFYLTTEQLNFVLTDTNDVCRYIQFTTLASDWQEIDLYTEDEVRKFFKEAFTSLYTTYTQ